MYSLDIKSIKIGQFDYNIIWNLFDYEYITNKEIDNKLLNRALYIHNMIALNKEYQYSLTLTGGEIGYIDIARIINILYTENITKITVCTNGFREKDWFDSIQNMCNELDIDLEFDIQLKSIKHHNSLINKLSDTENSVVYLYINKENYAQCIQAIENLRKNYVKSFLKLDNHGIATDLVIDTILKYNKDNNNIQFTFVNNEVLDCYDCFELFNFYQEFKCTSNLFYVDTTGNVYNGTCQYRKQKPIGNVDQNSDIRLVTNSCICKNVNPCIFPNNTYIERL